MPNQWGLKCLLVSQMCRTFIQCKIRTQHQCLTNLNFYLTTLALNWVLLIEAVHTFFCFGISFSPAVAIDGLCGVFQTLGYKLKTKNLTIQEAIQSGKPFKRAGWLNYFGASNDSRGFYLDSYIKSGFDRSHMATHLTSEDLLATDWEIKAEPRVIYVNMYVDGDLHAYHDKGRAERSVCVGGVTRKFVEVIE